MEDLERTQEISLDLKESIVIIRHWAWLLVLGLLLGAGVGLFVSTRMAPVYLATTKVLITRSGQPLSSDVTAYLSDLQLVQTYLQVLNTRTVLDMTSARTGVQIEPEDELVKAQVIADTQVIKVDVEYSDPRKAALIANTIVDVLIEQNEVVRAGRYDSMEESIQAQITQVEKQINSIQTQLDQISTEHVQRQLKEVEAQIEPLQNELSTLQQEIAALDPGSSPEQKAQIAEKQARIDEIQPLLNLYQQIRSNLVVLGKPVELGSATSSRLTQIQSTLDLYQKVYINLLSNLETVRLARLQNTPNIVQIEPASVPDGPIRPRILLNTILAALVGLMLVTGIVFLIEYLDDTLKTPKDVKQHLGLPVLGFVAEMQFEPTEAEEVYVKQQPHSAISEAFRSLRTNLEFASAQERIHTLLVTSSGPTEGKSTVAVNLAAILALSGKRVALVDANMRHPKLHSFFGMSNQEGLSNLFRNPALVHSVGHVKAELPYLRIIPSGNLPPNPAELLGSKKMDQILAELCKLADVIVIDTPPSLVTDAQVLSGKVDAVLFVIWPGKTTTQRAKASLELFQRAGARVIGTVMNRIPRNRSFYYGGHENYSPYIKNGYFSGNGAKPEETFIDEREPIKLERSLDSMIINRTAKLSPGPEELQPPDPPKNGHVSDLPRSSSE